MKKMFFILAAMIVSSGAAMAQNYMVVDSEKIFRSIDAYTRALAEVEAETQKYQQQVDEAFNQLETSYNNYQQRKGSMSASARQAEEQRIVAREEEIGQFQSATFGEEGTIMKRRVELIKPIQDRVFAAIERYAAERGYDIALDIASNPSVLYHKPSVNHTDAIIAILK